MNALYSKLLIALQVYFFDNFTEIKYTELNQNQLVDYEIRPAVLFPCILIQVESVFEQRQFNTQVERLNINFTLATDFTAHTSDITPQEYRMAALEIFELQEKLYNLLQNWDAYGLLSEPLKRHSNSAINYRDGFKTTTVSFTAAAANTNDTQAAWMTIYNKWMAVGEQLPGCE